MIHEKYNGLPDGLEPSEVRQTFDKLFAETSTDPNLEVMDVMEALYQLADRQWHTFSVLPPEHKERLERYISDHWQPTTLEFVVKVGFIAGSVGLPAPETQGGNSKRTASG